MDKNRFRRFSQKDRDFVPMMEQVRDNDQDQEQKQKVKIKQPIDILKLSLRTMTNKLVALPQWVLPNDYTLKLTHTIVTIIEDAIKYNAMYMENDYTTEEEKPSLPNPSKQTPQSDSMINSLINDIEQTVKKNK